MIRQTPTLLAFCKAIKIWLFPQIEKHILVSQFKTSMYIGTLVNSNSIASINLKYVLVLKQHYCTKSLDCYALLAKNQQ